MSDSVLAPFYFEDNYVRIETIDEEPWFCANDVGCCLEISSSGVRTALTGLPEDDRRGVRRTDTPGGKQTLTFVNEAGLYDLVFFSRKPRATEFRRWVTSEVLPSIRKTGSYSVAKPGTIEAHRLLVAHHAEALAGWEAAEQRAIAAESTVATQAAKIERDEPAVLWMEEQANGEGYYLTKEIVLDSDTSLVLNGDLWDTLDDWCFVNPTGGHRRFRASFVAQGYGFNHLWTDEHNGHRITRVVPRWFPKGSAHLKMKLRELEKQLRI